jgi:ACDE family multidrug resistance protein
MTIGFVATAVLLDKTPAPKKSERISVLEPLRALRHREVRGSALTSAFYNFGFFTLLAYTPFPLRLGAHELGYVFFGWGLMLAIFAVFVAPAISRRIGDVNGLGIVLALFAALLAAMGVLHASQAALIVAVVVAGTLLGIVNTLMTQLVMESAPVERPVASAGYSFVRFCGGAIAPFVAGKLSEHVSVGAPFYLGAGMTTIAVGVLWMYRGAFAPARHTTPVPAAAGAPPMVVAVGGPAALEVATMAVPLARARGSAVRVLHVLERDVVAGEDAVDRETTADATALLDACIAALRASGAPVSGELVRSVGSHADVADHILSRAADLGAGAIVLGPDSHEAALAARVTSRVAGHAPAHVVVLNPAAGALGRPLAAAAS